MRRDRDEALAAELTLEELVALRPARMGETLPPGARGAAGERISPGPAQSLHFEGVSPYAPGDDPRRMDWRATARAGSAHVRRFSAERRRAHVILPDLRPELYFGLRDRLMAKSVAMAAARLAWFADMRSEAVCFGLDGTAPRPARGRRRLMAGLEALARTYEERRTAAAPSPLAGMIADAGALLGPMDEIHVIGDFTAPDPAADEAAGSLAGRMDVIAWVVEDRAFRETVPRGRYPWRTADGRRMEAAVGAAGVEAPEAAAEIWRRRADRLARAGWSVREAEFLLPQPRFLQTGRAAA